MYLAEGHKGALTARLQTGLKTGKHYTGTVDGDFGPKTADALKLWQRSVSLPESGVLTNPDIPAWNKAFPSIPFLTLKFATVPADKVGNTGFTTSSLRDDAARAYLKLYHEIKRLGGIMTSDGGRRHISAPINANRSRVSLHYTGRAFDLATQTGMQSVVSDPYLVVPEDRCWNLWFKTPRAEEVSLQSVTWSYKLKKTIPAPWRGRAYNFTQLASTFGFHRIPYRASFTAGEYLSAEWWHFQYTEGLIRGQSTFGEELYQVYGPDEVARGKFTSEDLWERVWGQTWR